MRRHDRRSGEAGCRFRERLTRLTEVSHADARVARQGRILTSLVLGLIALSLLFLPLVWILPDPGPASSSVSTESCLFAGIVRILRSGRVLLGLGADPRGLPARPRDRGRRLWPGEQRPAVRRPRRDDGRGHPGRTPGDGDPRLLPRHARPAVRPQRAVGRADCPGLRPDRLRGPHVRLHRDRVVGDRVRRARRCSPRTAARQHGPAGRRAARGQPAPRGCGSPSGPTSSSRS